MIEMLEFAKLMNELSDGVFNPLVGAKLNALGYGHPSGRDDSVADFSDKLSWNENSVMLEKGQNVDLGGLGKGWVIDKISNILRENEVAQFIVNGGGDLHVQSDQPIEFALENPHDNTEKIGTAKIQKGALAASSVLKRVWRQGNQSHHHIIDPATADSSDGGVAATFVMASSALVADCLATILIIRPDLESKLKQHFDFQAKIIYQE
jgi:FAD:protein FMN transferase